LHCKCARRKSGKVGGGGKTGVAEGGSQRKNGEGDGNEDPAA